MTDFALVSYDEDTGLIMFSKKEDDGREWYEPVAISIPDLFWLFKTEGIDPAEMAGETCFEFHKAKLEIGSLVQAPCDEDCECDVPFYYEARAIRQDSAAA